MQATDPDTVSTINYRITSGADGLFSIDSRSGIITVTSFLDYETKKTYTLIVSTDDGRSQVNQIPEAQTTVNVNVLVGLLF